MNHKLLILVWLSLVLIACKEEQPKKEPDLNQVILISKNHPKETFRYYLNQMSIMDSKTNSGPYTIRRNEYLFIDEKGNERFWAPKLNEPDTLIIQSTIPLFEITNMYLPLTKKPISWLVKKGDTIEFEYRKNGLIWANIKNRHVNDTVLNYDNYKILVLNDQRFEPDVFPSFGLDSKLVKKQQIIKYQEEILWMDKIGLNSLEKRYRKNSQTKLDLSSFSLEESSVHNEEPNWSNQDSLIQFRYFREDLRYRYSKYGLQRISVNYDNQAGFSDIDQKKRFDSIINDLRFSDKSKDFLLVDAYSRIIETYSVEDIETYTLLLKKHHSDSARVQKIIDSYNLDFNSKDRIELLDYNKNETTLSEVLNSSTKDYKVIYFWATWCGPCKAIEPKWDSATTELNDQNVQFFKLAKNDEYSSWKENTPAGDSYFISNSKSSMKLEEFQVYTIPRFVLLDKKNNILHANLKRPGQGFKNQITTLIR